MTRNVTHVGIDFDNTIVCYDDAFRNLAIARGLLGADFAFVSKRRIRAAIRDLPGGNWEWTKLQAYVYGPGILAARPFEGFTEFLRTARQAGIKVSIVSHKSEFAAADLDGTNLRDAAMRWLRVNRIVDTPLTVDSADVYFEGTLEEKLMRIATQGCSHFVDDLQEVLQEPGFPSDVQPLLFSSGEPIAVAGLPAYPSWSELHRDLLGIPA